MKKRKSVLVAVFILFLFSFISSCSCQDENLFFSCPEPRPCLNAEDGSIQVFEGPAPELKGECKLGYTSCDEDNNEICINQVLPKDEVCDGLDNNCDGSIDEGLSFDEDGDLRYSADSCRNPTDCDDNDYNVHPGAEEICDGKDNDCDGETDEVGPYECWLGPEGSVFENTACETGITSCVNGSWTECVGMVLPSAERCDGVDNDCDGIVDNNVIEAGEYCGPYTSAGACEYGEDICFGGELYCVGAVFPQEEICDGIDNDCDYDTDEELERICETECGIGIEICSQGDWVACSAPTPQIELCDGQDNDCDGEVDEGCLCVSGDAQACVEDPMLDPSTGEYLSCGMGIQFCDEFGVWGDCLFLGPDTEVCNNWDDDCDGVIDGMTVSCGFQSEETVGFGDCKFGVATCIEGEFGECIGEVLPEEEICDGLDNDCDGEIDEDLEDYEKVDMVFAIDISGSMCPYINALIQGITTYIGEDLSGPDSEHRFGLLAFPEPDYGAGIYEMITNPSLVDYNTFLQTLQGLQCNGSGSEPSYNVAYELALPNDPAGVGWRDDAQPYIIMITDEMAQSNSNPLVLQSGIVPYVHNCEIGACEPGDRIEFFVISKTTFLTNWSMILDPELDRFHPIAPASGARYTEIFRDIFSEICVDVSGNNAADAGQ